MMALINLMTIIPAGAWADRFGRKRTIVPSAMLAAGALCLFAFTDSIAVFLGAAALLALGTGISGPAPAAYAADVIPEESRGLGMGLFRTYSDIGFVTGGDKLYIERFFHTGQIAYEAPKFWCSAQRFK